MDMKYRSRLLWSQKKQPLGTCTYFTRALERGQKSLLPCGAQGRGFDSLEGVSLFHVFKPATMIVSIQFAYSDACVFVWSGSSSWLFDNCNFTSEIKASCHYLKRINSYFSNPSGNKNSENFAGALRVRAFFITSPVWNCLLWDICSSWPSVQCTLKGNKFCLCRANNQ